MEFANYGGEVYVTSSFLQSYGLKKSTIDQGTSRFNNKKSYKYEFLKDNVRKSKKWIRYDTIPIHHFEKHNLPNTEDLLDSIRENELTRNQKLIINSFLKAIYEGFKDYQKYYNGIFHDLDSIYKYSKIHAFIITCNDLRNVGIKIKELWGIYQECNFNDLEIKSSKTFYRRLKKFETEGNYSLIHASIGSTKPRLLNEKVYHKIESFYRNVQQFSNLKITNEVNNWCVLNGYKTISYSTVKAVVSKPEFMNKNKGFRYGREWSKIHFNPFKLRLDPEKNGTLWQIDGSPAQIYYKTKNNRMARLQLFVAMDVHSRKIIGYAFGKTENSALVKSALKDALHKVNFLPRELVRDGGGAFKEKGFELIEYRLRQLGCYPRIHRTGNPNDKGHVERFFGTLQSTQLKYVDGYIGEGIMSKREGERPAKEVMDKFNKLRKLRTRDKLEDVLNDCVLAYNRERVREDKPAPNEKYAAANLDPSAIKVDENEVAFIFWRKAQIKVKNSMIIMTEGKYSETKYQYIIDDIDLRYKLNLTRVTVAYQKKDRSVIKLFDENDQWITNLERNKPIPIVRERAIEIKTRKRRNQKIKPRENKELQKQYYKQKASLAIIKKNGN